MSSRAPLFKDFISLGEGRGISVTLWKNSLRLERRERQNDGTWLTTQQIALAPKVLEYLFARIPIWIAKMSESNER